MVNLLTLTKLMIERIKTNIIRSYYSKAEGFPRYLKEANKIGMDVNDWIEQKLGWPEALPILKKVAFPYYRDDSIVCELGVGTGRWARHILTKLANGYLYLVDHSPWIVNFLREYFQSNSKVSVYLNDGHSLPFPNDSWIDFVFSDGTFIELNLSFFYLYAQEFFRVLKPSGYCVFDYIDITTPEGWKFFKTQSKQACNRFTYHTPEAVDKVFSGAGLKIIKRHQIGKSMYLVVRKPPLY